MLEGLDHIDWSQLHDAYGPSGGTPGRIRALASPSKSTRDRALRDLFSTIYHQGTIYAASVAAVPFLLEIVASSEVADRTPTLEILQGLSTGCSYHEAHASLIFNREKSKTPEWQEEVRKERAWVSAIHEQLSAAVPTIANVLHHGRPEERLAAVSLLATLQDTPAAVEALRGLVLETNPTLTAAALNALGASDSAPVNLFEQCFEGAGNELVRTVAALQLLYHRGKNSPPAAVEYLLNHLRSPKPELREAYEKLPDTGAFLGALGKTIACGPTAAAEAAFPLLYEEVKRSPYTANESETFGVLILAVNLNPPPGGDWTRQPLSIQQRKAIRMVADRAWRIERGVPTISGNIQDLLGWVGLPTKREAIFAMLAGTPEGEQTPKELAKWSSKKRPWWKFF